MEKPTIVILHGWGLSARVFQPLVSELKKLAYPCLVPDLPGFGSEPAPVYPWRLRDYVRFVDDYFKKQSVKRAIFVGHSFGGRISLKFSQLHPDKVLALVLTGTPGFTPIPRKKLILFVTLAKIGNIIFSLPPLNLVKDSVRRWYYYVVGARDFFRAEGVMRDIFKTIVAEELVSSMQTIKVPTLLIWGEYDIIVPSAIAQQMHEVIPHAQLVILPEADHGVPFKQPEAFAGYVNRFINKNL